MKDSYLIKINKNRTTLMGIAILWIFMLHSGDCGYAILDQISSIGWIGVDFFFFLSAIGLCYSLEKHEIKEFYKRRAFRILPTWYFILLIVHIAGIVVTSLKPELPLYHPRNIFHAFCWYTGIGYWISDFFDYCKYNLFYEWYIPTLLSFYLISPIFYKKSIKILCLFWSGAFILSEFLTYHELAYNLHFSYQRIPIFILGFIYYKISLDYRQLELNYLSFVLAFIALILLILNITANLQITKTTIALFATPSILYFFACFLTKHCKKSLGHVGAISLELYLIHLYGRPQYVVSMIVENVIIRNIIAFVLCVLGAYLIHIIVSRLTNIFILRFYNKS